MIGGNKITRYIESDYDLGYIFGTFLGDGHAKVAVYQKTKTSFSESGSTHWYFGINENNITDKLKKCIKDKINYDVKINEKNDNILKVDCYNKMLTKMLFQFGKKTNKHLPDKYYCKNKK